VKTARVMPERISAVLFDLDGVLVDSTEVVERSWRRWALERSLPPDDVLAVAHGRPTRDVVRMLAPHLDVDEEVLLIGSYESSQSSTLAAVPGARDCVDVARRGRWAVVTSGIRDLATERLIAAGLPVPEVLVTADDVTHGKPDPEPYERARSQLSVPANECVVIEDAPPGISAGKSAGMTVLAITTTHAEASLQEADGVFATLDEITRCLLDSDL
jgi:mannitol-1-/sugar-/sorbitol-6-phosphatase